jgi:hypothetical protein
MPRRNFGTSVIFGIALMLEMAGTAPGRADCIPGNLATPAPQDPVAHVLANPGRVVFPTTQPPPVSGCLALTQACQVR